MLPPLMSKNVVKISQIKKQQLVIFFFKKMNMQ